MTEKRDPLGSTRQTGRSAPFVSPRNIVRSGMLLIALSLCVAATQVGLSVRDLQARIGVLGQLAQGGAVPDLGVLRDHVSATRSDLAVIRIYLGWLFPLTPELDWLPVIGGDLGASGDLFNMADAVVGAADVSLHSGIPFAGGNSNVLASGPEGLMALLVQAQPQIQLASDYLATAAYYRARLTPAHLSARTLSLVERFDRVMPLADLALTGGLALPELMGANGPRAYLILVQNEDERRATGGFVSAAGLLTVERGKITSLEFMDSFAVDNPNQDFPPAPAPLEKYMLAGYWLFRDANWSPDFPTSARQLAKFYEQGQARHVDGVIAIDQEMVRLLVQAAGPFDVPGTPPIHVTADNIVSSMREAWTLPADVTSAETVSEHKKFIGVMAKALQSHLLEGGAPNPTALARGIYDALRGHHLQLYFPSSPLAQSLSRVGWDGALHAASGDYLMVVDSNVGFNKADALITRQFQYVASIASDLGVDSTLSIRYRHDGAPSTLACTQGVIPYVAGTKYETLMNQCYWDYLRLYVPGGSSLIDATRYPIPGASLLNGQATTGAPETLAAEFGKIPFATFFLLERGAEKQVRFTYRQPGSVIQRDATGFWSYRLFWQKQPGSAAIPTQLSVTLPPGATLVRVCVPSAVTASSAEDTSGLRLNYTFTLDADATFEIVFRGR